MLWITQSYLNKILIILNSPPQRQTYSFPSSNWLPFYAFDLFWHPFPNPPTPDPIYLHPILAHSTSEAAYGAYASILDSLYLRATDRHSHVMHIYTPSVAGRIGIADFYYVWHMMGCLVDGEAYTVYIHIADIANAFWVNTLC